MKLAIIILKANLSVSFQKHEFLLHDRKKYKQFVVENLFGFYL